MTVTRLLIARHGNTFGPEDVVTRLGTTDLPLVASGLAQGRALGLYLAKEKLMPDIVFTSQLKRTIQTAIEAQKAMGTSIKAQPLSIFNEIDYGIDENKPETEVVERLGEEALKAWDQNAVVPLGWNIDPLAIMKNWQDFAAKIIREHKGKTVLVVTSNGIARFSPCLTGDFKGFMLKHKLKISTGSLCSFENQDGTNWICRGWNVKPEKP